MSDENAALVRRMFEDWNRGDQRAARASMDPEIEVESKLGGTFDGVYRGYAELAELMTFWGEFESYRSEIEECLTAGDDVIIRLHHYVTGKSSGIDVDSVQWQVYTIAGGRIVRWRMFTTRAEAFEAAGLEDG